MRGPWPCALLLGALAVGCGYRFTAGTPGLPQGLRSLRAPVFANRSSEPNVELLFTQALREQLVRTGTAEGEEAAGQVSGEVLSVSSSQTLIGTYRVAAAVQLQLVREGQVLAATQVADSEEYLRAADPVTTESNRQAALRRLADAMMRDGYDRLAAAW